jgi:hypothetical protein
VEVMEKIKKENTEAATSLNWEEETSEAITMNFVISSSIRMLMICVKFGTYLLLSSSLVLQ